MSGMVVPFWNMLHILVFSFTHALVPALFLSTVGCGETTIAGFQVPKTVNRDTVHSQNEFSSHPTMMMMHKAGSPRTPPRVKLLLWEDDEELLSNKENEWMNERTNERTKDKGHYICTVVLLSQMHQWHWQKIGRSGCDDNGRSDWPNTQQNRFFIDSEKSGSLGQDVLQSLQLADKEEFTYFGGLGEIQDCTRFWEITKAFHI